MEQFFCKTQVCSGPGSAAYLAQLHIKRLFLVTDPFFYENGTAQRIAAQANAEHVQYFPRITPDPTVELAAEGTQAANAFQPDAIVALGGGSAMDCAKAITYFSHGSARLIAIPTTSGSGSDVTNFAILTHNGVKHPLVDPRLQPDLAILDGELLTSLPPALIADTGFDLISHSMEAWAAAGAGTVTNALAADALDIAFASLPASFAGDTGCRQAIHDASTMAGMAFSGAGLGLCHAISHVLGGAFHAPHGRLNAILLPAVLELNAEKALHRYGALARRLNLSCGADPIAFRALKNALIRLRRELALPETLSQTGIPPAQLRQQMEELISAALADPCCATNPVVPRAHHIRHILQEVMGHG